MISIQISNKPNRITNFFLLRNSDVQRTEHTITSNCQHKFTQHIGLLVWITIWQILVISGQARWKIKWVPRITIVKRIKIIFSLGRRWSPIVKKDNNGRREDRCVHKFAFFVIIIYLLYRRRKKISLILALTHTHTILVKIDFRISVEGDQSQTLLSSACLIFFFLFYKIISFFRRFVQQSVVASVRLRRSRLLDLNEMAAIGVMTWPYQTEQNCLILAFLGNTGVRLLPYLCTTGGPVSHEVIAI